MNKKRRKVMYVLEERDDIIDFAEIYEKITGEKYVKPKQK
jgi:hypothetical protein